MAINLNNSCTQDKSLNPMTTAKRMFSPCAETIGRIKHLSNIVFMSSAALGLGYFSGFIPSYIFRPFSVGIMALGCIGTASFLICAKKNGTSWIRDVSKQLYKEENLDNQSGFMKVAGFIVDAAKDILNIGVFISGAASCPALATVEVALVSLAIYSSWPVRK